MEKILFISVLCFSLNHHLQAQNHTDSLKRDEAKTKETNQQRFSQSAIQHFIVKAGSNTYGYSIYIDGQLYICQTTIPAMPGSSGFPTAASAEKAAFLVVQKIKEGELPPMLTKEEMRRKKIIL